MGLKKKYYCFDCKKFFEHFVLFANEIETGHRLPTCPSCKGHNVRLATAKELEIKIKTEEKTTVSVKETSISDSVSYGSYPDFRRRKNSFSMIGMIVPIVVGIILVIGIIGFHISQVTPVMTSSYSVIQTNSTLIPVYSSATDTGNLLTLFSNLSSFFLLGIFLIPVLVIMWYYISPRNGDW